MTLDRRIRFKKLLSHCSEATEPSKGDFAVFLNDRGELNYTGIITEWPMIVTADIELGEAKELDATKAPFADKTIRYFSIVRDSSSG